MIAENAWPKCKSPVGEGANLVGNLLVPVILKQNYFLKYTCIGLFMFTN